MRRKMLVVALFAVMLMSFGRHRRAVEVQAASAAHAQETVGWDSEDDYGGFDFKAFAILSVIAGVLVGIVLRTRKPEEDVRLRR